jgi:hypothetical protein
VFFFQSLHDFFLLYRLQQCRPLRFHGKGRPTDNLLLGIDLFRKISRYETSSVM